MNVIEHHPAGTSKCADVISKISFDFEALELKVHVRCTAVHNSCYADAHVRTNNQHDQPSPQALTNFAYVRLAHACTNVRCLQLGCRV